MHCSSNPKTVLATCRWFNSWSFHYILFTDIFRLVHLTTDVASHVFWHSKNAHCPPTSKHYENILLGQKVNYANVHSYHFSKNIPDWQTDVCVKVDRVRVYYHKMWYSLNRVCVQKWSNCCKIRLLRNSPHWVNAKNLLLYSILAIRALLISHLNLLSCFTDRMLSE